MGVRNISHYIWSQPSNKPIISVESWKELWLTLIWEKCCMEKPIYTLLLWFCWFHLLYGVHTTFAYAAKRKHCCFLEILCSSILLNYYYLRIPDFSHLLFGSFFISVLLDKVQESNSIRSAFCSNFAIWCSSAQCVGSCT